MANYTLPDNIGFESFSLTRETKSAASSSPFTFKEQILVYPGQRWVASASLPPLERAKADVWRAWLTKLNGLEHTFTMGDPLSATPKGSAGGTPLLAGASQVGSSIDIDGASSSQTGWLLAGDFIQLGTGANARLYMVTDDVDTDGSGNATINIWPNIRVAFADNTAVVTSNTVGAWRLNSASVSFQTDSNSFTQISFSANSVV